MAGMGLGEEEEKEKGWEIGKQSLSILQRASQFAKYLPYVFHLIFKASELSAFFLYFFSFSTNAFYICILSEEKLLRQLKLFTEGNLQGIYIGGKRKNRS